MVELLDELLGALLGLGRARAVSLELVQDLGELVAPLVGQVVDDVARGADDVGLEAVAELGHRGFSQGIGRGGRSFSAGRRRG
jgi:hypothetical protein